MTLFDILLYCTVFSLAYSWVLVWILERREKKYGQGALSFTDAFLSGAVTLVLVYASSLGLLTRSYRAGITYDVALLTALAGFCLYRESLYRLRAKRMRHRRLAEIRLLNAHIAKDPSNAVYYERLSEVFERLGETGEALEAARMAAKLDPAVRNQWRVRQLEESRPRGSV